MLPAVPAAVLAWQCSGFFKGLRQPARAVLLENGGVVVLTLIAFTVAAAVGLAAEVSAVGYAFLAANLGVMGGRSVALPPMDMLRDGGPAGWSRAGGRRRWSGRAFGSGTRIVLVQPRVLSQSMCRPT